MRAAFRHPHHLAGLLDFLAALEDMLEELERTGDAHRAADCFEAMFHQLEKLSEAERRGFVFHAGWWIARAMQNHPEAQNIMRLQDPPPALTMLTLVK